MQTRISQLSHLKPDKIILKYGFNQSAIIGRGSYGIVYIGRHIETKQLVAIKVVPSQCDQTILQKEIGIMNDLDCPNIVKFLDFLQTQNNCYIISELCTGGDLREFMKTYGALPEQAAHQIITQILKGILQSFKKGIIHRDLKPANILIADKNIFKIADFGFAKRFQHLEGDLMNSLAGTPLYMSPQVLLRRQYTAKCDVWSIGLIFYELIEGKTPWNVTDILDLVNKQKNGKIIFNKQLSKQTKQFIIGCLQYEENNRLGWEQVFTHPLFENQFILKEEKSNNNKTLPQSQSQLINNNTIKQVGSQSQITNPSKLLTVHTAPVMKSPLQISNKQTTQKFNTKEYETEIRNNFHSKTLFIPQTYNTLKKERTLSIGSPNKNNEILNNKQKMQNQIEFLLILKQIRLQLLDYMQVTTQTTTIQKLQFILLKHIMIRTSELKIQLLDKHNNILDLKDFQQFIITDTFKTIEKQILELHFDSFNLFQESCLDLNEKYNLFINDYEFLEIFDNNFVYSVPFCQQAKTISLHFIRSYLYQIILGYENQKIQLFSQLLGYYAEYVQSYSTNIEEFLIQCKKKLNRQECITYIEKLVFN